MAMDQERKAWKELNQAATAAHQKVMEIYNSLLAAYDSGKETHQLVRELSVARNIFNSAKMAEEDYLEKVFG